MNLKRLFSKRLFIILLSVHQTDEFACRFEPSEVFYIFILVTLKFLNDNNGNDNLKINNNTVMVNNNFIWRVILI